MFDISKSIEAQENYCKKTDAPHFAPGSGRCWKCNRNLYEQYGWKFVNSRKAQVNIDSPECTYKTGIEVEEAGSALVTGCPHCNWSYCD